MGYGNNEHVVIRTDYPEITSQLADISSKLSYDDASIGIDTTIKQLRGKSGINPNWDKWLDYDYSAGMYPTTQPVWTTFEGAVVTDSMFVAKGGKGRWNGLHVFEGWSKNDDSRLSMLIDKVRGISDIWHMNVYVPADQPLKEKYGRVRVGSDVVNTAVEFSVQDALSHVPFAFAHREVISSSVTTNAVEIVGGNTFGALRNAAGVTFFGGSHASRPGYSDFYIGSVEADLTSSFSFSYLSTAASKQLFSIDYKARALFSGAIRVVRLAAHPELDALPPSGFMYFNTTTNRFVVNENGVWKNVVTEAIV